MKTKVLVDGNSYHIFKHDGIMDELPVGVYEFRFGPMGQISLDKQPDLKIPEKVYSNDEGFIKHVSKSFDSLEKGLLGVGLVGGKGLGKSFTANILAEYTGKPVIKLTKPVGNTGFLDYLKQVTQDYVLYIDEFEKLFPNTYDNDDARASQEQLLSFLDGGTPLDNKVLFIITSNAEYKISNFIKNRPSRLRYFRRYEVLDDNIIKEVVEDLLENKDFLQDLLDNIPYDVVNLDALIKIIQEINLHNTPYSEFKSFFNFKEESDLNVKVELVLPDGSSSLIVSDLTRTIYAGQRLGSSNKLVFKEGLPTAAPVFAGYDIPDINETPVKPLLITGHYHQVRDGQKEDVECTLRISANSASLASKYVY